jgi:hypothetical protein
VNQIKKNHSEWFFLSGGVQVVDNRGDFDIQMVIVLADGFQKTFKLRSRFRTAEKVTVEICCFSGISMTFSLKFSDPQSVDGAGARFQSTRLGYKTKTAFDRR